MSAEKLGEEKQGRRRRLPLVQRSKVADTPQPTPTQRGLTPKGRATPSRRHDEDEDEGNVLSRTGGGLSEYLKGVRSELDKVAWPSREDWIRLTIIVTATLIASSIVLGIVSAAFTELFRIGLNAPIILFVVIGVAVAAGLVVFRLNSRRSTY